MWLGRSSWRVTTKPYHDESGLQWGRYNIYLGLIEMATHLPRILRDIAVGSESRDGPCPVCDGVGYVAIDSIRYTCAACDGVGRVRLPGKRPRTPPARVEPARVLTLLFSNHGAARERGIRTQGSPGPAPVLLELVERYKSFSSFRNRAPVWGDTVRVSADPSCGGFGHEVLGLNFPFS